MILQTDTKYGPCAFYGKDEYIGRSLYSYGEWSGEECSKIVELMSGVDGTRAIDCGANIGFMTMALAWNGYNVEAFEPQPEIAELLRQNVVRYAGVRCYTNALGAKAGSAIMPRIRYGDRGNYGGLGLGSRSELGSITVSVVTLDSYNFKDVGLIKIDVEGYEREVLLGATELIKKYKPILYVEDDRENKSWELRKLIKSLGYEIEEHNPPMYRENNYKGLKKNIWGVNYISKNIICRPC